MISHRSAIFLLLLFLSCPAQARDESDRLPLAPFENYKPPPHMFDKDDEEEQALPVFEEPQGPSLTGFKEDKPPTPPRKPKPPKKEPLLSKPIRPEALKPFNPEEARNYNPKRRAPTKIIAPSNKQAIKKPAAPKAVKAQKVVRDIDSSQLVNPTADDVLASIIGKEQKSGKASLSFAYGESLLSPNMKTTIINDYVPLLHNAPKQHVQIQAYAPSGKDVESAGVRRLALARVVEIRDFLISQGVKPSRINIKPLAEPRSSKDHDQVEIMLPPQK